MQINKKLNNIMTCPFYLILIIFPPTQIFALKSSAGLLALNILFSIPYSTKQEMFLLDNPLKKSKASHMVKSFYLGNGA